MVMGCDSAPLSDKTDSEMAEFLMAQYLQAPDIFEPKNNFEELAEAEIRNSLKEGEKLDKFWVTKFDTVEVLDSLQRAEALAVQDSQILATALESNQIQLLDLERIIKKLSQTDTLLKKQIIHLQDSINKTKSQQDSLHQLLGQLHRATTNLLPPPKSYVVMCGFMITNVAGEQFLYAGELDFLESFELLHKEISKVEY